MESARAEFLSNELKKMHNIQMLHTFVKYKLPGCKDHMSALGLQRLVDEIDDVDCEKLSMMIFIVDMS